MDQWRSNSTDPSSKSAYSEHCKRKVFSSPNKLRNLTTLYKSKLAECKARYFQSLATHFKNNIKKFWKFFKRCSTDCSGRPDLKHNGRIIADDGEKAAVFIDFFKSVFTAKAPISLQLSSEKYAAMEPIFISMEGIIKLLDNIEATRGPGSADVVQVGSVESWFVWWKLCRLI